MPDRNKISLLYDKNSAMNVISGLLQDPTIIYDDENFHLAPEDFPSGLYQIIFSAIYNMSHSGFQHIGPKDIDLYLAQFEKQYQTFHKNKGYEFLVELVDMSMGKDIEKFRFYYTRLKKFRILRDFEEAGIDTTRFFNTNAEFLDVEKEQEKLNNLSIEDIMDTVRGSINEIENNYLTKNQKGQHAGIGLRDLYLELQANPEIGEPLEGDILNYAVRGARYGKFYLNSAPTGQGKTRFMAGNACALAFPRVEDGKVIFRNSMQKILFISTEMQPDEIQTLILAYVSGVNEAKILYNNYSPKEKELVEQAIEIIEKYQKNFIIEYIADPSIHQVRTVITKYVLNHDIAHVFYDYIFSSPGLLGEFRDIKVREDVALMMLSNTLKEVASTYNVYIQSATQLNEKWEKAMVRNQNHLRGSKAIADKVDIGMISIKLDEHPEEEAVIRNIIENSNMGLAMPNIVIDIYKNRRGQYTNVKILRYFDYGTCRVIKDIAMLTSTHKILDNYNTIEYQTHERDLLDLITEIRGDQYE